VNAARYEKTYSRHSQQVRKSRATCAIFVQAQKRGTDRCFLPIDAKRQTILRIFRLPLGSAVCGRFSSLAQSRVSDIKKGKPTMPKRKHPTEPFRPTAVVSPVPSERRFTKGRPKRKSFDVYVTDIETGEVTLAIPIFAVSSRDALQIARKKLLFSPLLRNITHAAFSAVEVHSEGKPPKGVKPK
jgi:hypothetical protein